MNKKNKYGFLIISFILLIGCSRKDNQIIVDTKDGLSTDKVEIRKGFTTINRENDLELFSANLKTIFNGNDKGNLETDFGENDFLVIYNDSCYYSFRHFIFTDFKSSYPKGHEYNFEIFMQNDSIFMAVNIQGEEPMEFTRALIKREFAENYRCNTPIKKAGVMFNMIEMDVEKSTENKTSIIKNTQQRIKTDCFYDLGNYRIYFSQFTLNNYCDSILNQSCSSSDSIFYKSLKDNCVKHDDRDNNTFALELFVTQDVKVRDLQTDKWTTSVELIKNENQEWMVKGVFESDTITLINKARKHNKT